MVAAFPGGDWSDTVTQNQVNIDEIVKMSDDFADGIIEKLPDDFK